MILSRGAMTDLPAPPARRFQWPAEYYSGPTPNAVFPRWVPFGCGAASVLMLAILVAGGVWLSSGGLTDLMDWVVGMTMGEVRGMYTSSVTPPQRQLVDAEVERVRKDLRANRISVAKLDPLLRALRDAASDSKVDPDEAQTIVAEAHAIRPQPAH